MNKQGLLKAICLGACGTLFLSGTVFSLPAANGSAAVKSEQIADIETQGISVIVNGVLLEMDAQPFIEKNRTLVPVRAIMEKVGAEVNWHPDRQLVEVKNRTKVIELVIGAKEANIRMNGEHETVNLDASAKIVNGRTFIPGRFLAETLGATVKWDSDLRAMMIFTDAEANVNHLVENFGEKLQLVSLLAPEEVVTQRMEEIYQPYVTQELLENWKSNPEQAPGRLSSSPWPDRIDILNTEQISAKTYQVTGEVIEVTSVEVETGGVAAKRPITLTVQQQPNEEWLISQVTIGDYVDEILVEYTNSQYGFQFILPETWQNYKIVTDQWEGTSFVGDADESGPTILIRHPQWTAETPRQDIPIMILTQSQWQALEREEFHIGAAPIGPKKLGENSDYVFALPARYNFAFPTGYEEVEEILEKDPLLPIDE